MKKIFIFSILLLTGLLSCTKLDTVPTDFPSTTFYFNNETELNFALTGVYDILGKEQANNLAGLCNTVDETFNTGTTGIQVFNYDSSLALIATIWQRFYQGIERANILLANIEKPKMDEAKRNVILGEAKFLRAYYYFMLVQNYGAVPFKTKPTESVNDIFYPRTPANEIYEFITREMEEAEALVEPTSAYPYAGRVTKSAVRGILARVNLYWAGFPNNNSARYAEALKWAKKLIESQDHSLNPDFSQVFINMIQDKYDTKESIWEIEFNQNGLADPYTESSSVGVVQGIAQNEIAYGYSIAQVAIQDTLFRKFTPVADLRRDWSIAPYSYQGNNTLIKVYYTADQVYNRKVGKFRREYELGTDRGKNTSGINLPLLRYSDVLLMAAEAENEVNGPANAYGYVNQVRRRGYGNGKLLKTIVVAQGGAGYTSTPVVTLTGGGGQNSAGVEPAAATAVVSGGKVSAIKITFNGTFYTSPPTVNISGGGGTGATAMAVISPLSDADLPPAQTASKEALRLAIQDERSRELCFEGFRRNDLIRWGILVPAMKAMADLVARTAPASFKAAGASGVNISDKHNFFPIPLKELSLNNLLTQNQGW